MIKKDHVAAGLCCIQLFMNSASQEEAIKHLENSKVNDIQVFIAVYFVNAYGSSKVLEDKKGGSKS